MNEVKVVVTVKDGKGTIGVKSPNCDPIVVSAEGDVDTLLTMARDVVSEARQRWQDNPLYPKFEGQLPSQAQRPQPATRTRASRTTQPSTQQTRLF